MAKDLAAFGIYPDRTSFEAGLEALRTAGFRPSDVSARRLERTSRTGAASAWLPAVLTSQLISVFLVKRLLHGHLALLSRPILGIATASIVGAAIAVSANAVMSGLGLPGLILSAGLSLAIMGILIWTLDRRFALGIVATLPKAFPQVAVLARFSSASG